MSEYTIQFYPQSCQTLESYRHKEQSYICEALTCPNIDHKDIFLVHNGHCFAACNFKDSDFLNEQSRPITILYMYTLEASRRKGHCAALIKFIQCRLRLDVNLFSLHEGGPMDILCKKLGMEQRKWYVDRPDNLPFWLGDKFLMNPWRFPVME